MYACRSVSVACRPAEKRRRRGEIGSIHRSILVGHRRPNRPQGVKARINNRLFLRSRKITLFKTNIENMRKERCKNRSKLLNKPSGHRVQIRSFVRCSLDQNQNLLWRQGLKCIKVAWLRARRETRRGSIFCSRSHRFHLV